ncbi:MAG: polysaccharide deacetylase family protein [Bdellovibrionota bacterium]
MRILHILSQKELTGAEVYALQLGEWCVREGHEVYVVSDELHRKTKIPFFPRPVHDPSIIEKFQNFFWLRRFLIGREIQVIHCHSRAGLRMAHWARRGLPVALVSTVHGVQHFSLSKRLFDLYGEKVLAVCENLKKHLVRDFRMKASKIRVVRNPITVGSNFMPTGDRPYSSINFALGGETKELKILVVGRTSGPKGQRASQLLRQVVPHTLKKYPQLRWDFVGGPLSNLDVGTQGFLRYLQQLYRDRVRFHDKVENLPEFYAQADLVVGAGRVALEAALFGRTVLCLGEAGSHGLLTDENLSTALESNFGDIGDVPMDTEEIVLEIESFFQNRSFYEQKNDALRGSLLHETDPGIIGVQVVEEYKSAIFKRLSPRWIPILMYHKILPEEVDTPHRTFVTTPKFDLQMRTLKRLGFSTLTFKDLFDFREGKRNWRDFPAKPVILTFDDGYKNNLEEALPVLKKQNFKGTFFLLSDATVSANVWDEKVEKELLPLMGPPERKLLADSGMEIGSHGLRHEKVISKNDPDVYQEWSESKEKLEAEFGKDVVVLAYPFGDSDSRLAKLAQLSNYAYAVNTDQGAMHIEDDRFQIFRVSVFPEDGPLQIWKKTSPWYRSYYFRKRGR